MTSATSESQRTLWQLLGPGIVFAGAAVGVSHLVQSTRAGAVYGLGLIAFIVFANLMKYAAFRFGPHYAAATGRSLLHGYLKQGKWAVALYGLVTVATMFTVQAAVTFLTAGLAIYLFDLSFDAFFVSIALMVFCYGLLAGGSYAWLDKITKIAVALFTVTTLIVTALALGEIPESASVVPPVETFEVADWLFVAALIGWMPSAIDVSVWQSLWTLEKKKSEGVTLREVTLDFHVGYIGSAVLALAFVILGAATFYDRGIELQATAGGFAAQLVGAYQERLGEWSGPLVGLSALLVMFSTTFAVSDGFPRAIAALVENLREERGTTPRERPMFGKVSRDYAAAMLVILVGASVVIATAGTTLKGLVDLATTASFLTAPILSWLNHRAATSDEVPREAQPSSTLLAVSGISILLQAALAIGWLAIR